MDTLSAIPVLRLGEIDGNMKATLLLASTVVMGVVAIVGGWIGGGRGLSGLESRQWLERREWFGR